MEPLNRHLAGALAALFLSSLSSSFGVIVFDDGFTGDFYQQGITSNVSSTALDPAGSGETVIAFLNPANDNNIQIRANPNGNPGTGPVIADFPIFRFEMYVPAGSVTGTTGTETSGSVTTGLDRIRFAYSPDGVSGRIDTDHLLWFANLQTEVWETHEINLIDDLGFPGGTSGATLDRIELRERFGQANETFYLRNIELVSAIPEPGALSFLALAGAALLGLRRRRS